MPDAHKAGLFRQGVMKAIEFIDEFSSGYQGYTSKWLYYKSFREISRVQGENIKVEKAGDVRVDEPVM